MKTLQTCLTLAVASFITVSAPAAVIFEDVGGGNWRLDFDPITFTAGVTGSADYDWLIFEDFFQTNSTISGGTPSEKVRISINGDPVVELSLNNVSGPFNGNLGELDQNDMLINFTAAGNKPTINAGDTILVSAPAGGFLVPIANSALVPAITNSPTVDVRITSAGTNGSTSTDIVTVAIPEPSSFALAALGLLGLIGRRRRK